MDYLNEEFLIFSLFTVEGINSLTEIRGSENSLQFNSNWEIRENNWKVSFPKEINFCHEINSTSEEILSDEIKNRNLFNMGEKSEEIESECESENFSEEKFEGRKNFKLK